MIKIEVEKKILKLLKEVENLTPTHLSLNETEWDSFEHKIWQKGEQIRQLINGDKKLRSQPNILEKIVEISTNRNIKRGRQSFIMLLGNVDCKTYAPKLIKELQDKFVKGHVIDTIYKMKTPEFVDEIKPFCNDKETWIRNKAKQYVEKYDN